MFVILYIIIKVSFFSLIIILFFKNSKIKNKNVKIFYKKNSKIKKKMTILFYFILFFIF